jgi:hypothetical protein
MAMTPPRPPHTYRRVGPSPARILPTVVPRGLDDYHIEIEAQAFDLPRDLERLVALGARYGHEFIGPPLGD